MEKMSICLWFHHEAEEAARFYTGIFKNSEITDITRNTERSPVGTEGSVLTVSFTINDQVFLGLNGGSTYQFNPAMSIVVTCQTQKEVDCYYEKLQEGGGQEMACGWVTDRYGVSWQVVPEILPRLLAGEDRKRADRVMRVMMQMKKLVIVEVERP